MLLRSTLHPPCPETHEVVEVRVPTNRRELSLTDRLSLRIGLWLLVRAERSQRKAARVISHEQMLLLRENQRTMEREALTMLTYGLQRFGR